MAGTSGVARNIISDANETEFNGMSSDSDVAPSSQAWQRRSAVWIAFGLVLVWILFLAYLSWSTQNQVTLNQQQILDSSVVLVGRALEPDSDDPEKRFRVEPVEGGRWPLPFRDQIVVQNLDEAKGVPGKVYLFPLKKKRSFGEAEDRTYAITPTHLQDKLFLIYPATADTLQQLDNILKRHFDEAGPQPRPPVARD